MKGDSEQISGVFRDPDLHYGINLEGNQFNESVKDEIRNFFIVEFNFVVGNDLHRLHHRHNNDFVLKL